MSHSLFGPVARVALFSGLVLLGGSLSAPARAEDAPKETVRAELGPALQAAQNLMKERRFKEALAKIKEAEAIPNRTPYENFIIDRMRGSAAANDGDDALAASSFESVVASARLPAADQLKVEQAIAGTYFKLKNYSKSASWAARYLKEGGSEMGMHDLLVNSYYLAGDYAAALGELRTLIDADEKAGRNSTEVHLQLLLNCYQKTNDSAGASAALEKLLVAYPKKEYWDLAISHLVHRAGFAERLEIDLLRLRAALGDLRSESDYMELAQLDLEAGFPAEAKKFFDQGYAKGVLGKGPEAERQRRLQNKINQDAAADLASLREGDVDAEKARTGDALLNTGYNYVINGKFQTGVAMIERGLQRNGLKRPEDGKLHAGIAFFLAGENGKAAEVLHSVQGKDGVADLAHLWAIFAGKR